MNTLEVWNEAIMYYTKNNIWIKSIIYYGYFRKSHQSLRSLSPNLEDT